VGEAASSTAAVQRINWWIAPSRRDKCLRKIALGQRDPPLVTSSALIFFHRWLIFLRRRRFLGGSSFSLGPCRSFDDILRASGGKNIKTLAKKLGLSHTAASQHVRILRSAGLVEAVLVDQDDPRLTHQRLTEKHLVTDDEGKQWLDFGKVKICLD
jgi:DNA-binding transcriptional ArsR family regulator